MIGSSGKTHAGTPTDFAFVVSSMGFLIITAQGIKAIVPLYYAFPAFLLVAGAAHLPPAMIPMTAVRESRFTAGFPH